MNTKKLLVVLGGLVAVLGQFWGVNYYLPLIGGAVAVIVGLTLN